MTELERWLTKKITSLEEFFARDDVDPMMDIEDWGRRKGELVAFLEVLEFIKWEERRHG